MSQEQNELVEGVDRWRQALSALGRETGPRPDCLSGEQIWQAAGGELGAKALRQVVEHMAGCAHCGEAFRLAGELGRQVGAEISLLEAAADAKPTRTPWVRPLAAAAAVVLAVSIGFVTLQRIAPSDDDSRLREAAGDAIDSLVEEGASLPRAEFLLRWSPGPEGSLYSITVADEDLDVLASDESLELSEYLVPAEVLAELEEGAAVLWRVSAHDLDGSGATSATFINRVE